MTSFYKQPAHCRLFLLSGRESYHAGLQCQKGINASNGINVYAGINATIGVNAKVGVNSKRLGTGSKVREAPSGSTCA